MTVVYRIRHAARPARARADLSSPMVISDTMPETQSMANGRYYTSKAAIRASYLPSGNPEGKRYVELGDAPQKPFVRPKPDRIAVRAAIEKAAAKARL